MIKTKSSSVRPWCSGRAFGVLVAAGLLAVTPMAFAADSASTPGTTPGTAATTGTTQPNVDFTLPSPVSSMSFVGESSSSSSSAAPTLGEERASLTEGFDPAGQPPPRRRYGRPRYEDKMHNADGSTKIAFEAGGGFTNPVGSTGHWQTTGYNFSVGGGLNFNKAFGVLVQFDWDNMGLPAWVIQQMQANYQSAGASADDVAGLDGSTHLWSFTVNPVINFQGSGRAGAYVTGGVGYYKKVTNFTLPSVGYYCDYYYCYPVSTNQTVDSYSSGAFGVNGGFGLTYKLSNFSNAKLFAEAKYVWVNNQRNDNLLYAPNSYRTGYIPVKFGVRY